MKKFRIDPKGFFKVLGGTAQSQAAEMTLSPGGSTGGPTNKHIDSDQWLFVISGKGEATIEGRQIDIQEGELVLIEANEAHEIRNTGRRDLKTFNIYSPPEY